MEGEGSNQPAGGAAWRSPEPPCARAPPGAASPLAFWGRFGTEGHFCLGSLCRFSQGAAWLEAAVLSLGTPRPPAMELEEKPFVGDPQGEGRRGVPGPHGAGELWDPRGGCPCLLPTGLSLLGGVHRRGPPLGSRDPLGWSLPGAGWRWGAPFSLGEVLSPLCPAQCHGACGSVAWLLAVCMSKEPKFGFFFPRKGLGCCEARGCGENGAGGRVGHRVPPAPRGEGHHPWHPQCPQRPQCPQHQ